jgi:hypothetical protein
MMKKLFIILLLLQSFVAKSQVVPEWYRADSSLSVILLNEDLEPLTYDTNIYPSMYEFIKWIPSNGHYVTFSAGKDSLIIEAKVQVSSQIIGVKIIAIISRLIIKDGVRIPPKYEPEKFEYSNIENSFYCSPLLLLFLFPIVNRKKLI